MNVCVFCSASDVGEPFESAARDFAAGLGREGHSLVWGGSDTGLMHVLASTAQQCGARIIGVSVEFLRHKIKQDADEMIVALNLPERKKILLERSDALIIMVGGVGTLDEATEMLELKKHRHHDKPIIFLNTDGFYDGLRVQLEKMGSLGFLPRPLAELAFFASTADDALLCLTSELRAD
ncbi:MAG: TIGR00730 family Rossman fold protein [Pseudonocardiaceae bacterium]